jgi:hypothetical protein
LRYREHYNPDSSFAPVTATPPFLPGNAVSCAKNPAPRKDLNSS